MRQLELLQLIDLLPHLFGESFYFRRRKLCRPKGIADLLIRKLGQVSADPLGMLPRDVREAPEIDVIRAGILDQRQGLEVLEFPLAIKHCLAGLAKARSQVGGNIALFTFWGGIYVLVRALEIDVANDFHHDLQAVELFGSHEWIFVP